MTLDQVVVNFDAIESDQFLAPFPRIAANQHDPFKFRYHLLFAFFFQLAHLEIDDEKTLTAAKLKAHIKRKKAGAHPDKICLATDSSYGEWCAKSTTVCAVLDKAAEYLIHYLERRNVHQFYWMHK